MKSKPWSPSVLAGMCLALLISPLAHAQSSRAWVFGGRLTQDDLLDRLMADRS